MKDIFVDVVMNPHTAIDVAKYLSVFFNMKQSNPENTGNEVRRSFLQELESSYNGNYIFLFNFKISEKQNTNILLLFFF